MLIPFLYQLFFIGLSIIGIGLLIGFHEFGHFIFCKIFGIKVPSFSIGMGPKIFSHQIGSTLFSLSAIPLGGYCEVAHTASPEHSSAGQEEFFDKKPYYQKVCVIGGGILLNLLFAYLLMGILFFTGMPLSPVSYPISASNTISVIQEKSPASQALQVGDTIRQIDHTPVTNAIEIIDIIRKSPGKTLDFSIDRQGSSHTIPITLATNEPLCPTDEPQGFLGTTFTIPQYPFWQAMKQGVKTTHQLMFRIITVFKHMFSKKQFNNLGGPLMIIAQTAKASKEGFSTFLLMLVFISINLALLNILPLPILDGGQLLFCTIETLIKRPLPERIRMYIGYITWFLMAALFLYLIVKDFLKIFIFCS